MSLASQDDPLALQSAMEHAAAGGSLLRYQLGFAAQ